MANDVAQAINALGHGPRYVGMYAYNEHSPPPAIAGHSNVIVNIATSFIRGGYSVAELVEGWRASGVTLGIRDYHDVFTWSHDLPRRARGGNLSYLSETIPFFYERRARFMNSESSDSWGANGLGYWLSPLMLWDVDQARRLDVWIDDFLNRAFETAAGPMRAFYELLNTDRSLQTDENVIARMYACLAEAYACGPSPAVRARLDDLVLYTRYVELYHHYRGASGEARQAGFEAVVRHAYRMRDRYMVLTQAIYYNDQFRDDAVSIPPDAVWGVKEPDNPWKERRLDRRPAAGDGRRPGGGDALLGRRRLLARPDRSRSDRPRALPAADHGAYPRHRLCLPRLCLASLRIGLVGARLVHHAQHASLCRDL